MERYYFTAFAKNTGELDRAEGGREVLAWYGLTPHAYGAAGDQLALAPAVPNISSCALQCWVAIYFPILELSPVQTNQACVGACCVTCDSIRLQMQTLLLTTLRIKLQPGVLPFPVLRFWDTNTMYTRYHGFTGIVGWSSIRHIPWVENTMPVSWHFTGIYRPLPVSRLPSEDQRKTGCSLILSVVTYFKGAYKHGCVRAQRLGLRLGSSCIRLQRVRN